VSQYLEQLADPDHPTPEGYLDYLKLRQAATALPANVQKSTLSDDR
jgi:hypothetical protein